MESEPLLYVKKAGTDFTRKRKLSMSDTIRTITCMHGGSLNKELYDMYKDSSLITPSAFVQQRNKIKLDAFKNLFYQFNQKSIGYDTNTFCGCQIFAVDGTVLNIPRNPQSDTFMPKYGEKGINQFHINALYDVCNKTYKDVVIQPKPQQNENFAAQQMFQRNKFPEHSIVTLDRGYGGYNLFETVNRAENLDYVCRVANSSFPNITDDLPLADIDVDKTIEIRTTQRNIDKKLFNSKEAVWLPGKSKFGKNKKQVSWKYESPFKLNIRVVRFKLDSGEYETIITSLSREQFSPAIIKNLYHLRWGIETSFRELKYNIGLINLHSRKEEFIIQEIYAKLLMYNFSMRIALMAEIPDKSESNRTYEYQINFKMATHLSVDCLRGKAPPNLTEIMSSYIEPVRTGRHDQRKITAKGFIAFQYRVAA